MAKKVKKKKEICTSETEVARLEAVISEMRHQIGNKNVMLDNLIIMANESDGKLLKINQRIDRIVDAHEHCKSLRGL